jgi:3-oxoacyl-[acyl-carrier-protein] synthase-3
MPSAQIVSTGSFLPGESITNEQIEHLVGGLPEDVLEGIQVKTRHWMVDPATGEHYVGNTDMAYNAAKQALELAGIEAGEVDLIVTSTASPEYLLPSMAVFLQEKLGIKRCAAIEIRSGCAGAVEALDLARLYLERGQYRTAVVVGSEAISPLLVPVYLGKDPESVRMRDRLAPYNFGDGAGAIVLRASEEGPGIQGSVIASVGGDRKPAMQIIGAGTHAPIHKQLQAKRLVELKVDVVESGKFTPYVLTEGLAETSRAAGVPAEDIDLCLIPEGNAGYITEELEEAGLLTPEWTALEGKIFENLADVGATGSAAVPLCLDYAWKTGAVKQGDEVMLLAIETSKWIYAGMVFPWTAPPCPIGAATSTGAATAT